MNIRQETSGRCADEVYEILVWSDEERINEE
jgi:hypothetical protein